MKTLKTKEPKLAPKSDVTTMRENAARIEAGRANLAELKKVQKKAKVKAFVKKAAPIAAASLVGSVGMIGRKPTKGQTNRYK